jgi:hypothetical protein
MKPKLNRKPGGMDCAQTPFYAMEPLLPYLNPKWTYWDCAMGEGNLVRWLNEKGFKTIGTDILSGDDFLTKDIFTVPKHDCLITNPPYSLKYKFLEKCYEVSSRFALLMPVETLGAKTAQELFKACGVELMFLDHRVNFKMPNKGWDGQAQFPTMWFCLGLLPKEEEICWASIDPKGRNE